MRRSRLRLVAEDERYQSAAERLRALENSGDPDARRIAAEYKHDPLLPTTRMIVRATRRAFMSNLLKPTYTGATNADADEAEERYGAIREERINEARRRETELHEFAKAADRREKWMVGLTSAATILAGASLTVAIIALASQ